MSQTIVIRVEGLAELKDKLQDRTRIEAPVSRYLDRSAIYLQSRAREHITYVGAVDTTRTRGSIAVKPDGAFRREVGPNTTYAEKIEDGQEPGEWPPKGALVPWMRRKGIPASAEYLIRRKIGTQGIAARPFMAPAAQDTEDFIRKSVSTLVAEIEAEFAR